MSRPHVLILGAGSLATEIARTLPQHTGAGTSLRITIGSRDLRRARWVAAIAAAHAGALGAPVDTAALLLGWGDEAVLVRDLAALEPTVVVLAASLQSAWSLSGDDRWAGLVRSCGYAITAPLQLKLALAAQHALHASGCRAAFVNACYPDLLNVLLARAGSPTPLCGVGNIALIAELLRQHIKSGGRLRLIAGHADVGTFARDSAERVDLPPVWIDDERVDADVVRAAAPLTNDRSLNAFNAAESARVVAAIATGRSVSAHVPGPLGLPGGYPVRIAGASVALDLPAGVSREEAVALNISRGGADGGTSSADGQRVVFSERAAAALRSVGAEFSNGFGIADAAEAADAFVRLRERLSAPCSQPA